jgi:hypothetical protein
MPRPKANLEMVTLRLTKGAKEKLAAFYSTVGYNLAIRLIIDKHVEWLEQQIPNQNLSREIQAEAVRLVIPNEKEG